MDTFARCWKAVVGFIAPGAVIVGASTLDASAGGSSVVAAEWLTALVACIVTAAGVYVAPNRDRYP